MRLNLSVLAALCFASPAAAASFTVGPLGTSSIPTLAVFADLHPGPSPRVVFTAESPVAVRVSSLSLTFDEPSPQVSNSEFTVELGSIDAAATIPLSLTQDAAFQLHTDPVVIAFEPDTHNYLIQTDGSVLLSFTGQAVPAGFSFQYGTPLGAFDLGPFTGAGNQWSLYLVFDRRDIPNASVSMTYLSTVMHHVEATGNDPITGTYLDFSIDGTLGAEFGNLAPVSEGPTAAMTEIALLLILGLRGGRLARA